MEFLLCTFANNNKDEFKKLSKTIDTCFRLSFDFRVKNNHAASTTSIFLRCEENEFQMKKRDVERNSGVLL